MKVSMKHIVVLISSILIFTVFAMLYLNFGLVAPLTKDFNELYKDMNELNQLVALSSSKIDILEISVEQNLEILANVEGESYYDSLYDSIQKKYNKKYEVLEKNINDINVVTNDIKSRVKGMNFFFNANFKNLGMKLKEDVYEIIDQNNLLYQNILKHKEAVKNSSTSISELESYLNKDLLEIESNVNESFLNLLNAFIYSSKSIDNIIIGILVLLAVLLIGTSLRFLNNYKFYIQYGLEKITTRNFDIEKLELKKSPLLIFKEEVEIINYMKIILEEYSFISEIQKITSEEQLLENILEKIYNFINLNLNYKVDRLGIAFVDYENKKFVTEYGIANYDNLAIDIGYNEFFNKSSLAELLITKKGKISNNLAEELIKRPNSRALHSIISEGILSNMMIPLVKRNKVIAIMFLSSKKSDYFKHRHLVLAEKVSTEIVELIDKSYLMRNTFVKLTNTFAELVDKRDDETGGHLERMTLYSTIIAKDLLNNKNTHNYEISKSFVLEIERNAAIHDIGKVATPDNILKKPGKLTDEEWDIMRNHATVGGEIFKNLRDEFKNFDGNYFKIAEEIAMSHHEKWDGSGYPNGLTKENIPLAARIIAIADVFDALTSKRVYKKAFTFEKAYSIITENSGKHFDPIIVESFDRCIDKIKQVYNINK